MSVNWPAALTEEIARRRAVIFVGSGISRQCVNGNGESPKTWKDLLTAALQNWNTAEARKREVRRLLRDGDYLTSCEILRDGLAAGFFPFLKAELLHPNFQPAPIHDSLVQLGARLYATPNFDKILEQKMGSLPDTAVMVKNYYDDDLAVMARATIPTILKVHGTIDSPDKLIFTRADYAKARIKHRRFYAILEALAVTHTFLFLGCGLNDPDIKLILEDQAVMFSGAAPHYFVVNKGSVPKSAKHAIERNLNITFLEFDGGYTQLKPAVDDLVDRVSEQRREMQMARTW